jgi:1,4-alpha-glucan branching enzyme
LPARISKHAAKVRLLATQYNAIVYNESHDQAGNVNTNTERTMVTAVNFAPLVGNTRTCAEGRCRFAFGMAALSAGTPMFLMGEEIGAAKDFRGQRREPRRHITS